MKKIVGYAYKMGSETLSRALAHYDVVTDGLHKSLEETKQCFENDKEKGIVGKTTKPKFYRIVVEEVEE